MTLTSRPPNQQQPGSAGRKRTLDNFVEKTSVSNGRNALPIKRSSGSDKENSPFKKMAAVKTTTTRTTTASSPLTKSPGLTESGSSPLDRESPVPDTPTRAPTVISANVTKAPPASTAITETTSEPPAKKKRTVLNPEEKAAMEEAKRKEKEAVKEEKEKAAKEKERLKEEKAKELAAKAAEKAAKTAADEVKKQERAAKAAADEAKKQEKLKAKEEKERKKREKEEEAAKKAEEAAKKQRSQLRLSAMFKVTSQPKDSAAKVPAGDDAKTADTPKKAQATERSRYEQLFQPFFVKEHVQLAPNPCELDAESREAKIKILERYIDGGETLENANFDPVETLQIPFKVRRGRSYPSVKKIMAEFGSELQQSQARHTHELLKQIPLKSIRFSTDVRPAYIGTISDVPAGQKGLKKLARNPISRQVLPLAYDYDSEAEWQEEEGEDLDDLADEDEEGDADEDMDDFLDDSDDVGPSRMVFSGGMEPESSGLCWENRKRSTREPKMYKFRMEFIHEKLEHHHSIDPFSTAYWEPPKPAKSTNETGNQKSKLNASQTSLLLSVPAATPSGFSSKEHNANPGSSSSGVTDAFKAIAPGPQPGLKKSQQRLPAELEEKIKAMVREKPKLSRVGVIELFMAEHQCIKAQVRNSVDALIVKVGKEHKIRGE